MSAPSREEALFTDALAQPAAERAAFLAKVCGEDVALLARIAALVAAHEGKASLVAPASPAAGILFEEKPGDMIGLPAVGSAKAGRYKLLQKIGEGGCGVVWMAEQQEPVHRRVALKVIKLGMDTKAVLARFEAERQALAMMDHPNIAKVLDGGATETGRPFFVMELVRGIAITKYCDENHLTPQARLELFIKVCHAVQHAHEKAIIHRDLKPANILVTLHDGVPVPKVIDFGIAKATQGRLTDATLFTAFEQFIGTPVYMSPEQAEMSGLDVDTRSDIYSLGVLLYELLTGQPPFDPKTFASAGVDEIRHHIREDEPPKPSTRLRTLGEIERTTVARHRGTAVSQLSLLLRGDLDWVVMKCLEKDRTRRYGTANGLIADIERHLRNEPVIARPPSTAYLVQKLVRRHRVGVTAAAAIGIALVIGAIQFVRAVRAERAQVELRETAQHAQASAEQQKERNAMIRWAREVALPEIHRLVTKDDVAAAFDLAQQAEKYISSDPALRALWPEIAIEVSVDTTPAGADVFIKPYNQPHSGWRHLGRSPLKPVRLARAFLRWRITREGFVDVESADGPVTGSRSFGPNREFHFMLDPVASVPVGMVRVQARSTSRGETGLPAMNLEGYWIDRHEVTNRQFRNFVERGGYSNEAWWKVPFAQGTEVLGWSHAMGLFRDGTGQFGPSTWKNGMYAKGEGDHPVTGISWFEAAAYAESIGKRLPSIYHFRNAGVNRRTAPYIVPFSNFSRRGTARVGEYAGMGESGAYDMAGNAKEWCWNEANDGKRYILGGGWGEPEYMASSSDAQSPFDRSFLNGFRCIKIADNIAANIRADAPVPIVSRNYAVEKPVSEAEFEIFRRMFVYDKTGLKARLEMVDDSHPNWRKEKVSFNAAYNNERMAAFVFLPKKVTPPFQTIVYFPGATVQQRRSSDDLLYEQDAVRYVQSGRALIYPIYKGTFERSGRPTGGDAATRDFRRQLAQDVGRSIDYLETRSDIQADKLAYVGYSWGAAMGAIIPAIESRLKVNVLVIGGFYSGKFLAEVDQINYAPRVTIPTLMLNGRFDFGFPLEASQQPMFRLLGTPSEHKRHLIYETGHSVPENQSFAEALAWLDRYLGPVK